MSGLAARMSAQRPGAQVGTEEVSQNDAPVQGVQAPPNAGKVTPFGT